MRKIDSELVRAVLRAAERRLAETLTDLEANDIDEAAITERLKEIVRVLRVPALA